MPKSTNRNQPQVQNRLRHNMHQWVGGGVMIAALIFAVSFSPSLNPFKSATTMNVVQGHVFLDINRNGVLDYGEPLADSVKIRIFIDMDKDGLAGPGDQLVDSLYTNEQGMYEWYTFKSATLVIDIDEESLPGKGEVFTHDDVSTDLSEEKGGQFIRDNNIGLQIKLPDTRLHSMEAKRTPVQP
ncbi:MAG: hypothetical protein AAGI38_04220 [Bacteroidota bacterium]